MSDRQTELSPLVIRTNDLFAPKNEHEWNLIEETEMQNLIQTITTPDLNNEIGLLKKIISGIPSPWARAYVFKYALTYNVENGSGIYQYLGFIKEEWKALIAALILLRSNIEVKRVELTYVNNQDYTSSDNTFEFRGALGNMLFEDKDLWSIGSQNTENKKPFLEIIFLSGEIVGATSPHTLVFSSVKYNWEKNHFFKNGKFYYDNLAQGELENLYLYVDHIEHQLDDYKALTGISATPLYNFITTWKREIQQKTRRSEVTGLLDDFDAFGWPFSKALNTSTDIGMYTGGVFTLKTEESDFTISPSALLLPTSAKLVEMKFSSPEDAQQLNAHLLEVDGRYFALPLSELGVAVFENRLEDLLNGTYKNTLTATLVGDKVQIALTLNIDNVLRSFPPKTYAIYEEFIDNQVAILWPNFKTDKWLVYYFYSDFIHNMRGKLNFYPLLDKRFAQEANKPTRLSLLPVFDKNQQLHAGVRLIVNTPDSLMGNKTKYEIYKSSIPFLGSEIRFDQQIYGYLISKGVNIETDKALENVRVGIDFGSTNTCISYARGNDAAQLVAFKNRRIFLCGNDLQTSGEERNALPHEVFFFQDEAPRGIVKTMLMLHSRQRIDYEKDSYVEIAGGLPVFEKNVPVKDTTHQELKVDFGDPESEIIRYNMKWKNQEDDRNNKKAFVKTLWLKTCAELFAQGYQPNQLIWSFPLSMVWNAGIMAEYASMWSSTGKFSAEIIKNCVTEVSPLEEQESDDSGLFGDVLADKSNNVVFRALTESEAVCLFALSLGRITPNNRSLAVGFDVGGSTTDLLVLGQNLDENTNQNLIYKLIRQSSIKVAADKLAYVTKYSPSIQNNLKVFAQKNNLYVYGIDKIDSDTAGHLLNVLFDRLTEIDRKQGTTLQQDLYRFLWTPIEGSELRETKGLFAIAAYICGLTTFYAGQLTAQIVKNPLYKGIQTIQMGFYGNGGKLFDWLRMADAKFANNYYKASFGKGILWHTNQKFQYQLVPTPNYQKNEVSLGLSNNTYLKVDMGKASKITDIVGEKGYNFAGEGLAAQANIKKEHLIKLGAPNGLVIPAKFETLEHFLGFYLEATSRYDLIPHRNTLLDKIAGMNFTNYVQNTPDFKQAQKAAQTGSDKFDFITSPFILEGMCFLDQVLIPHLYPKVKQN